MYTLRKVIEGQEEINICLGERYTLIDKVKHELSFQSDYDMYFGDKTIGTDDECYAFVASEKGKMEPLWKIHSNYIMTENGKTFSNLSLK